MKDDFQEKDNSLMEGEKKPFLSGFSRYILIILGIITLVALSYALRKVLTAVTFAVVLFYMLNPLANALERCRIGKNRYISRAWAVMIACFVGIIVITLLAVLMIPPMFEQIKNFPWYKRQVQEVFLFLLNKLRALKLPPEVLDSVVSAIEKGATGSITFVKRLMQGTAFAYFFSQILLIFMVPFLTFYLLLEKETFKAVIVNIFPRRFQGEVNEILAESSDALCGYISGQLVLGLVMWIFITITLWLMGVKAPLFFGLIAGITKFIPIVGIFFGCIPAAIAALSTSKMLALWIVLIFVTIQLLENKVILPVMLSRYVELSPLTILCALIIGEQLGGILGMFISTPIAAVFRIIYTHIRPKYD